MTVKVVPKTYDPLQGSKQLESFLVCLEGIEGFIMALRTMDLVYQPAHTFNFEVAKLLPVGAQQKLLEPFHKVRLGPGTTCVVTGAGDQHLAERTQNLMQSRVFWERARLWEFIDAIEYKKVAADHAIIEQSMLDAHALHHDIFQLMDVLYVFRKQILLGDDTGLRDIWLMLDMAITLNGSVVEIQRYWQQGDLHMTRDEFKGIVHRGGHLDIVNKFPAASAAIIHFLCGMGSFMLSAFNDALVSFTEAARLMPTASNYCDGVSLARKWMDSSPPVYYSGPYMHDLAGLMTMLPKHPIQLPTHDTKSAIASLDIEKYVLAGLGYTGDLLEDKVRQKRGWSYSWDGERRGPFNQHMADLLLICHKRAMELETADGEQSKVWISTIKDEFRDVNDPETTYRDLAALATTNGTSASGGEEVSTAMRAMALQNDD